jgi:uncharacterized membrane protein
MTTHRLAHVIGIVLRTGVVISSAALAAGLACSLLGIDAAANILLNAGVVVLLATPVARVVASIVEYIGERDWPFVALTAIVLAVLAASVVAVLLFNRRL